MSASRTLLGRTARIARVGRWGPRDDWLMVLFHHVTDGRRFRADDPLVRGLQLDVARETFEGIVDHLVREYDVMSLDDALGRGPRPSGAKPAAVVSFDDAYASVAEVAAPILSRRGVPWMFFVNPGLVDAETLALDNLLAYVGNTQGLGVLSAALDAPVASVAEAISGPVASLSPATRRSLAAVVEHAAGVSGRELAAASGLYLSSTQLRSLADAGVEIGNHTSEHVHCRALDAADLRRQIVDSATTLREMTGQSVRAFSYPYGHRDDSDDTVAAAVVAAGHDRACFVHNRWNRSDADAAGLHRVSPHARNVDGVVVDLAVTPRMRRLKDTLVRRGVA